MEIWEHTLRKRREAITSGENAEVSAAKRAASGCPIITETTKATPQVALTINEGAKYQRVRAEISPATAWINAMPRPTAGRVPSATAGAPRDTPGRQERSRR